MPLLETLFCLESWCQNDAMGFSAVYCPGAYPSKKVLLGWDMLTGKLAANQNCSPPPGSLVCCPGSWQELSREEALLVQCMRCRQNGPACSPYALTLWANIKSGTRTTDITHWGLPAFKGLGCLSEFCHTFSQRWLKREVSVQPWFRQRCGDGAFTLSEKQLCWCVKIQ